MHRNKFRPIAKTNAHRKNIDLSLVKKYISKESQEKLDWLRRQILINFTVDFSHSKKGTRVHKSIAY